MKWGMANRNIVQYKQAQWCHDTGRKGQGRNTFFLHFWQTSALSCFIPGIFGLSFLLQRNAVFQNLCMILCVCVCVPYCIPKRRRSINYIKHINYIARCVQNVEQRYEQQVLSISTCPSNAVCSGRRGSHKDFPKISPNNASPLLLAHETLSFR